MSSDNPPIRKQLMRISLLTSGITLLITCFFFFAYELLTFRQTAIQAITTLGQIIAQNSTAALAFDNPQDAEGILTALKAERQIVAAALYDKNGKLFAKYPDNLSPAHLPKTIEADGYRFGNSHLAGFQPVIEGDNERLGTLYLQSNMEAIYARFSLYGVIVVLVLAVSLLVAYLISLRLQEQISKPILALAETARAVSDRRDYSVRAGKAAVLELGSLTDAFNHMLTQIQTQHDALQESELRVRAVLNSALSAVVVMDASGTIIDWNKRAEEIFGWSRTEAIGCALAESIIPIRYREMHYKGLQRSINSGSTEPRRLEVSALRRDGSEFPVELSISPLKTGGVITFCGFITDISERKEEEKTRAQLAAIVESSDDAIISKTIDGVITSWNTGAEKLFGYTAQECIGQKMLQLFPPELEKEDTDILYRLANGKTAGHFDTVRINKSGRRIDVSVMISPIKNSHGEIIGASKVARDITDRKLAQHKLQAQLGRLDLLQRITRAIAERQDLPSIFKVVLRNLEDNMPIDFGCVCIYNAAEELLTVTSIGNRSELLAKKLGLPEHTHIHIDKNGLARCIQGHLVYEADLRRMHLPFSRRFADNEFFSMVAAPLLVESKVFGVLIAVRRDENGFSSSDCEFLKHMTEHVALAAHQAQLYTALQQAYDDLRLSQNAIMQQERLRALGQMASGIAHDINNAISPVALYTESLLEREPNLSERARNYLVTIQQAIEDVANTVTRMREFYRAREPQLTLAPIALNQLAQQVIDLTHAKWSDVPQQRGIVIKLRTDFAANLPESMGADGEIRDALTNLIFNATDAMPDGGTLTVRTYVISTDPDIAATHVVIEVNDTGLGMDAATRQRCLEPFFTTKGERGTGLGLAMVYGMIQRHSADIEIESEVGRGTTVRLIFQVATVPLVSSIRQPNTQAPIKRLRILLVDDDPLLIKSMRDILEADGHVTITADGGQAGIDAFIAAQTSKEPIGIVITDLGMPYVDGRKVAATIKAHSPHTPIIMLTGWGQRMMAENDIPAHVDRLLSKPPKLHDLRLVLAEFAERTTPAL